MRPGAFRGPPIGIYGSAMRPGAMGPLGSNGSHRGAPNKIMVTHLSFDPLMADSHFGRATEKFEDTQLSEALVKKIQELTPSTAEQSSVQNLVSKVSFLILYIHK